MYFFLFAYSILGAGIKYIDDAFDKHTFKKNWALAITPFLSILGAYAMIIDPVSATILLAVLFGVLLKGKIDNIAFIIGFILVMIPVILAGVEFLILPLVLLAASAILDEVGNDFIDGKKIDLNLERFSHKFVIYFFGHRWIMKIAILYLVLINIIPFYFFIAMTLFDYAYVLMDHYTQIKQGIMDTTLTKRAIVKIGLIFT